MEPRISIITLGVKDLTQSYKFYKDGLGFPTSRDPEQGIVFFKTQGTCLALYPFDKLAEDAELSSQEKHGQFPGITLAHNVRSKEEVDSVVDEAVKAGGKMVKKPQDVFWGGYSGYFSDPDGYLWEVAYGAFEFNSDGSLIVT